MPRQQRSHTGLRPSPRTNARQWLIGGLPRSTLACTHHRNRRTGAATAPTPTQSIRAFFPKKSAKSPPATSADLLQPHGHIPGKKAPPRGACPERNGQKNIKETPHLNGVTLTSALRPGPNTSSTQTWTHSPDQDQHIPRTKAPPRGAWPKRNTQNNIKEPPCPNGVILTHTLRPSPHNSSAQTRTHNPDQDQPTLHPEDTHPPRRAHCPPSPTHHASVWAKAPPDPRGCTR